MPETTTKVLDVIESHPGNVVPRDHGVESILSCAMVSDQMKFVRPWLGHSVNGHAIHARIKVRPERFRVLSQLDLLVDLRLNELLLGVRVEWMKGIVVSERPCTEMRVGERPKTFVETDTD